MGFYGTIARPALFTLPAETAHSIAAAFLEAPYPWGLLSRGVPEIPTDMAGIALANPVGVAAGFDKNARMIRSLGKLGFGYVVVGTVTRKPRKGNPRPRIVRTPSERSITNSMGIPNEGVRQIGDRLRGSSRRVPVLASLADEAPADLAAVHADLSPMVAGFELNISSPNSPWRHERTDDRAYLAQALSAIEPTKPLFVKLPPFEPDSAGAAQAVALAKTAMEGGAAGLTIANTRPVPDPRLEKGAGGLSGGPLTAATPRMIEVLAAAVRGAVLNACGGIGTAADARRCLDAGATTVQLYTSFIYEGPGVVGGIVSGLAAGLAASA